MSRDETVTDEYVAELKAKLAEETKHVEAAHDWQETQKRIVTGTYAYQTALDRIEQGWTRDEIESELRIRTGFGKLPNPMRVIGNRRPNEEAK